MNGFVILITLRLQMTQDDRSVSKCFLYFMFTVEIIAWELAIALVILLGAQGYVGFNGTVPITVTCTTTYFTTKYLGLFSIIETAFIGSLVAVIALTFIFIATLVWVVRVCKGGNPNISVSKNAKIGMYLLANIGILGIIPPFGYYLSQVVQLNNCTATYNSSQIIIILVIAAMLLAFTFLYLLLILFAVCRDDTLDSKYRDIQSHPTEPQQLIVGQVYKSYYGKHPYVSNSPKRQTGNHEYSKNNLLLDPYQGSKVIYSYQKQESPKNKFNEVNRHLTNKKSIQESEIPSKYAPSESPHYISPSKKAEADGLSRQRRRNQDEEDFQFEQNRFLSKMHGGSILPLRGVEERSPFERKGGEYVGSGDLYNRRQGSPPKKLNREEAIISHIKGKYAN